MSEADDNREPADIESEAAPEDADGERDGDENGGEGPTSKDTHELGAAEARAYIPPTALAPKSPVPKMDDQKVRLADELNPRAVRTQPSMAREEALDAQGVSAEEEDSSGSPPGAVNKTGEMAAVDSDAAARSGDNALPFVKPGEASATPAAAGSQPGAAGEGAAAAAGAASTPGHDAAVEAEDGGPSPWSAEEKVDADLLPSAAIEFPSVPASDDTAIPSTPPEIPMEKAGSRTLLVGALGLAAVVLVGAIIFVAASPEESDEGPASVQAGSENREYVDETTSMATASATETPGEQTTATPSPTTTSESESTTTTTRITKPVVRPPRRPVDIYGDLD